MPGSNRHCLEPFIYIIIDYELSQKEVTESSFVKCLVLFRCCIDICFVSCLSEFAL